MRFSSVIFATALLLSATAFADDILQLDLANKPFNTQKDAVLNAVNTDVKYSEITNQKRTEVSQALSRISQVLDGEKQFSSIGTSNRQQLLADQQLINTALDEAKRDSRMVCAKEPVIGSNLPKRVCKTAAARNRENELVRSRNGTGINKL